jgi:hypothetical protein
VTSQGEAQGPAVHEVVAAAEAAIQDEITTISKLSELASQQPYYKNNFMWTRSVQDVVRRHGGCF